MKACFSLLIVRFNTMLQYRGAALAGFICQLFFGLVMVMVFDAFYASSYQSMPMGFSQTVAYIWLGQSFLRLLPWNVDGDFQEMVTTGAIAYELLRPLDLHLFWFIRSMAAKAAGTVLRAIPMLLLTAFVFPLLGAGNWALLLPASLLQAGVFLAAMLNVLLLSAAITTAANISLVWSISGKGTSMLINSVVTVFSGMIIPLPFFPDAFQWFLAALPFRGIADAPYRIFTGHIPPAGYWGVLVHQWVWILFFIFLGRRLAARASRKMVVQGG